MKRLSGFLAAMILSLGVGVAFADGTKIGVVDLQKIMQTAKQMKEIQKKLEKEFKPRRDKLVEMEKQIKQEMEKFKRDSAVMSQAKRKELEKKIISEQRKFEQEGQQYQQELSTAHNEAMEEFYNKIRQAIAKVAEQDKYDIVLQKDAAPFSADKLDVTNRVLEEIS
ncbi:OmpH family outer membrane protein [Legionella londiniensis]|uniref:Outer membrane protein OmpH n=1 Tax=Legionella londiniensis TaxID=45068 RepID=A0A0W0VMG2_9GAMM|nr:OmpH family outer membrane protein [Legionella londiniensis]KTD21330.1 outer membrane protein OmpH [Legionella londiniensis]STX93614.1 outer membrane protein OmpH [Legionella londiniensis]